MSGDPNFKSKDFAFRAQKKILGQFSSRKVAKVFINDNHSTLLDLLYQLIKSHSRKCGIYNYIVNFFYAHVNFQTKDKKVAEKFVKNIIKLIIKIGVLANHEQFSQEELKISTKFVEMFNDLTMTMAGFIKVERLYDRSFLIKTVTEWESQLQLLVKNHLTAKSLSRIQSVANHLRDPSLLDASFKKGTPQSELMIKIVKEMCKAIGNTDLQLQLQ